MKEWYSVHKISGLKNNECYQEDILTVFQKLESNKLFCQVNGSCYGSEQTALIKLELVSLGLEKGFWVYANRMEDDEPKFAKSQQKKPNKFRSREWLYDIHWYKDSNTKNYTPIAFPLVIECEWQYQRPEAKFKVPYGAVMYDFQKLLITNSDLKVLIFRTSVFEHQRFYELDCYFDNAIQSYPNLAQGSKFLFICFYKKNVFFCEKFK